MSATQATPATTIDVSTLPAWARRPGVLLELVPIVDTHFYAPGLARAQTQAVAEARRLAEQATREELAAWLSKHSPATMDSQPIDSEETMDAWVRAVELLAEDARAELAAPLEVVSFARRRHALGLDAAHGAASPLAASNRLTKSLAAGEVTGALARQMRALLPWCQGGYTFRMLKDGDGRVMEIVCR